MALLLSGIALSGLCALYASTVGAGKPGRRARASALDAPAADPQEGAAASPGPSSPAPAGAALAQPQGGDDHEAARIQTYLDAIYKRSDVTSSFRTKYGEDIDCIDFYAQASVKREIANGHEIHIPDLSAAPSRAQPRKISSPDTLNDVAFNGQPDENGNPRRCFGMTVPVVRQTVAQIKAAGGLDKYLRRRRQPIAPPVSPPPGAPPADRAGYMHATGNYYSSKGGVGPIFGANTTTSVWKPGTNGGASLSGGHSLAQTWTTSASSGPCDDRGGANCVQTIEMGWMVEPGTYQQCDINDNCSPDSNPHLFIFSTQDGYYSTGCYDGYPCNNMPACGGGSILGGPCLSYPGNLLPNPFMATPGATLAPGMASRRRATAPWSS